MRLNKAQLSNQEALIHVRAMLNDAWSESASVYLISPGNNSKSDYAKLAKDHGSRVIAVRSVFSGWREVISFILAGSYVGVIEMKRMDSWASAILELAKHGYIFLVSGKQPDIEEAVIEAVQIHFFSEGLHRLAEKLAADFKLAIVNAEEANRVDIESNW